MSVVVGGVDAGAGAGVCRVSLDWKKRRLHPPLRPAISATVTRPPSGRACIIVLSVQGGDDDLQGGFPLLRRVHRQGHSR